jgi:hypothetical protein
MQKIIKSSSDVGSRCGSEEGTYVDEKINKKSTDPGLDPAFNFAPRGKR